MITERYAEYFAEIERLRAINAELLAALEDLALYVDTEMVHPPRVVAHAEELIAKAKGETP